MGVRLGYMVLAGHCGEVWDGAVRERVPPLILMLSDTSMSIFAL